MRAATTEVHRMRKIHSSRREFLQTTAGVASAALVSQVIPLYPEPLFAADSVAPSDRVPFAIVAVAIEASNFPSTAIQLPGVECPAACDLYDGRHELAREIVGKPVPTTRKYQELLDHKEIDAIVIGVPDHWHKQIFVDALAAGKDVYIEKPMSHN